jgi:1-acyl-sn-glycerol-3-phosphate acyltransferase
MDGFKDGALTWNPPEWREVLCWPLPHKGLGDRLLLRAVALVIKRHVRAIHGLENLPTDPDPFILVANHSSRREAVVMPAFLMLHRGGRLIHFLADWNFQLIPGVGFVYRRAGAIVVAGKPARPRFLDALRPLLVDSVSPIECARRHLAAGRAIGIFPEGAVNRDPTTLLPGRNGAARLSLETGAPVVPTGLRFPDARGRDLGSLEIIIGPSLRPPPIESAPAPVSAVRRWHATLMSAIARLSGKAWKPRHGEGT